MDDHIAAVVLVHDALAKRVAVDLMEATQQTELDGVGNILGSHSKLLEPPHLLMITSP